MLYLKEELMEKEHVNKALCFTTVFTMVLKSPMHIEKIVWRKHSLLLEPGCEPYNLIPALGTLHFSTNLDSFFPNLPGEQNQKILASFPLPQSRSYSKLKYPFIALILFRVSLPWEAQSPWLSSLELYFCGGLHLMCF